MRGKIFIFVFKIMKTNNMKRKIWILCVLMAFGISLKAQPKADFDKTLHEFGPILWKKPVSVDFTVANKGDQPLVISNVTVSCGCTAVDWTKQPILAGQKGTIKATFDAKMLGHFRKTVGVYCNASSKPIYLVLQGEVATSIKNYSNDFPFKVGAIRMNKNNLEFSDANKGEKPTAELEIVNTSKSVYQPLIMHLPHYMSMKAVPATLSSGRTGKIIFTLDSNELHNLGLTQTTVYLARFLGDKVGEENSITVSAVLLPDFSKMTPTQKANAPIIKLSDDNLDLSGLNNKDKISQTILVTNEGKSKLEINYVQVFNPVLNVELSKRSLNPGETAKMKITAIAEQLKKARSNPRVLVITNDPVHPKVIISTKTN